MWKRPLIKKILRIALSALILLFLTSFMYALYLKWFPPFTTPLIVKRGLEGSYSDKNDFNIKSTWVKYSSISEYAKVAIIASEDQRFSEHNGFDYEAIEKAMRHNTRSKRIRGASTISQQVAKNVFLWPSRTWLRKGLEVYFTFLIETLWSKQRILQMYLNVAEMGDGIFGIQAASNKYYHKDALKLSLKESAMLAAILPNPRVYNPKKPSAIVKQRQVRIIRYIKMIGGEKYLKQL